MTVENWKLQVSYNSVPYLRSRNENIPKRSEQDNGETLRVLELPTTNGSRAVQASKRLVQFELE